MYSCLFNVITTERATAFRDAIRQVGGFMTVAGDRAVVTTHAYIAFRLWCRKVGFPDGTALRAERMNHKAACDKWLDPKRLWTSTPGAQAERPWLEP